MYSTYDQYKAAGGALTREQYDLWAPHAAQLIDWRCFGRAETADDALLPAIARCEMRLVDAMAAQAAAKGGALKSASTDGYSESYADSAQMEKQLQRICRQHLPHQLLYAGGRCPC